jgi:hypothetical protein
MKKNRKTTWADYHNENIEKKSMEAGILIKEACGRSRIKTKCPFCNSEIEIYLWHAEKRCTVCGAMCLGHFAFRVRDDKNITGEDFIFTEEIDK